MVTSKRDVKSNVDRPDLFVSGSNEESRTDTYDLLESWEGDVIGKGPYRH